MYLLVMAELAATAIISVHAQFPKNVVPNTEVALDPTNWKWKKCLALPVKHSTIYDFP